MGKVQNMAVLLMGREAVLQIVCARGGEGGECGGDVGAGGSKLHHGVHSEWGSCPLPYMPPSLPPPPHLRTEGWPKA